MNSLQPERTIGDAVFIKYSGLADLDENRITGSLAEKYVKKGYRKVVLDMENVSGLLSNAISRLVEMIKSVTLAGGDLFIVNVSERVLKILRSVKLDMRLKMYMSEKDFLLDYGLNEVKPFRRNRNILQDSHELSLEKTLVGDAHFIAVKGSLLEEFQVGDLHESARIALEHGAKKLIFDLKETPYIDSTSVSVFIRIRKLCQQHKATLEIVNAGEQVSDVFNLTGLASLLAHDA